MKARSFILIVCLMAIFSGCSNTRFLTGDQLLYTGRNNVEIIPMKKDIKTLPVRNFVKSTTDYKVNNSLFGRRVLPPVGLWTYNYVKTDKEKKFKNWLYKTFSAQPVLISDVNPELRASKIENDLFDQGYFNSSAWSEIDTSRRNPRKARITYFIELAPPYYYNNVIADTIRDRLDTLISKDKFISEIRKGDQFNLEKIKNSRTALSKRIQNNGYFYFIPDFVEIKADTTVEKNSLNMVIGKKKNLPDAVSSVYKINDIVIKNSRKSDPGLTNSDTSIYKGIKIISSGEKIKNEVLVNAINFRRGDTYSFQTYQSTTNRINNLGVFKYVNVSFKQNDADSSLHLLDVGIDLVKSDNIMADFEANFTTKSSGYIGPQISAGISHGNTFHGAERLRIGVTGGFEWQWGQKTESQLGTYSYQFGINSGLTFPRITIPFVPVRRNQLMMQRTSVNLEGSILNRIAYYKMASSKINLQYQWSKTGNIQHSFFPVYVNSVNLLATTAEFDSVVNENIYIRKSFEEQFIIGPRYEFLYNNTLNTKPNNFYLQTGLNTSGNIVDMIEGIGKEESERPYYFMNNIYSQYLKFTTDFRYYRNGYKKSLVLRLYAGLGIPYGNPTVLPYVEQFFSGGAYSVRGFTARYLGPGSYHEVDQSGYIDQSGDIKFETNIEYRFDMSKVMKGALFVDAGNIWLVNDDPYRPGAKFYKDTFYKQLAVSSGLGLRFDFTFFVLRMDYGFPIRNPYSDENDQYWLFGTDKIWSSGLFHLAIGYPF